MSETQTTEIKETEDLTLSDLSPEELREMLQGKIAELNAANATINAKDKSINSLKGKALKIHQENLVLKSNPELAHQRALMEYQLDLARTFITAKAFKAQSPEQAFVIIRAGKEMGLSEVESMQALYCVNGAVKYYGDKMAAKLTKLGYKLVYTNEDANGVDVRCFHPENGFDVTEEVRATDQILQNSKAMGFAEKNKMRFHGIRMIASFHLPHLFGSVQDEFTRDFDEWNASVGRNEKGNTIALPVGGSEDLLQKINEANGKEELELIQADHPEISRNITLVTALGKAKKRIEHE